MSYRSWTECGLGFCADDVAVTKQSLFELSRQSCWVRDMLELFTNESSDFCDLAVHDPTGEQFVKEFFGWYEGMSGGYGASAFFRDVIFAKHPSVGNYVVSVQDVEGVGFVLFSPCYPWDMNDEIKSVTEEDIGRVFNDVLEPLTGSKVSLSYQEVTCGG